MGPCMAITKLIQSSKAACNVVVKLPQFALPKPGTPEGEANHTQYTQNSISGVGCTGAEDGSRTDVGCCLVARVVGGLP